MLNAKQRAAEDALTREEGQARRDIEANAAQKLIANQVVNHPEARVHVLAIRYDLRGSDEYTVTVSVPKGAGPC